MSKGRDGGLWAPQRRALTAGLVLSITFVASEALAVVTVIPVAASYRPDPGTAGLYRMLYDEFVGLYKRNHKAHARLNGPGAGG